MGSRGGCGVDVGMKKELEEKTEQALQQVNDLNNTIKQLPANTQKDLVIPALNKLQGLLTSFLESAANSQQKVLSQLNKEFSESATKNISELGKIAESNSKRLEQLSKLTIDSLGSLTRFLGGELDGNTNKIVFATGKATDDLKRIADTLGLSTRETSLLFAGKLDTLLQKNLSLFNRILQTRINQLFIEAGKLLEKSNSMLEERLNQLDQIMQGTIQTVTWNTLVVAETQHDALIHLFGKIGLYTARIIILVFAFIFIARLTSHYISRKISLNRRTIIPVVLLIGLGVLFFSNSLMMKLLGKEFMTIKDFNKEAELAYKRIESNYKNINYNTPVNI